MPFRDKTGPEGKGPLTGRGLGRCLPQSLQNGLGRIKPNRISTVGFVLTGLIVKDAFNPYGVTRQMVNMLRRLVSELIPKQEQLSMQKDQKSIERHTHSEITKPNEPKDTL